MNPNLVEDYTESKRTIEFTSLVEASISTADYVRVRQKSKSGASITIREASTGNSYELSFNVWSNLLDGSSNVYCTKDSKENSFIIELIEYEPNFQNVVDDSHNWGEQTAIEVGKGLYYFPNIEEIVYSTSKKFIRNTKNRTTPLKIVYFGDSRCEVVKANGPPHPTNTNPLVVVFPGTVALNIYPAITNFCDLASFYPLARIVGNCGVSGDQTTNLLARDVSMTTGKAISDIISMGADVCISRFAINDFTNTLFIEDSSATVESNYLVIVNNCKTLIKRLIIAGIFHIFEGIEGYSNIATPTQNALRRVYLLRFINDMSSYIESLNSDLIEFVNPIGLTCDETGAYLPNISHDGIHHSAYGGNVKSRYAANILNRRFGYSLGLAYPGTNLVDAVVPPMMLTKVAGTYGDLATGVDIYFPLNCSANGGGVIEEIEEIKYQSMTAVSGTNGAGSMSFGISISIPPATIANTNTDTIGVEGLWRIEGLNSTLPSGTLVSFGLRIRNISIGSTVTVYAGADRFPGISSLNGRFVIPKFRIGIDYTDINLCKIEAVVNIPSNEVVAGNRVKLSVANIRAVKNPT